MALVEQVLETAPQVEKRPARCAQVALALRGHAEPSLGHTGACGAPAVEGPGQAALGFEPLQRRVEGAAGNLAAEHAFELVADVESGRLVIAAQDGKQDTLLEFTEGGSGYHV